MSFAKLAFRAVSGFSQSPLSPSGSAVTRGEMSLAIKAISLDGVSAADRQAVYQRFRNANLEAGARDVFSDFVSDRKMEEVAAVLNRHRSALMATPGVEYVGITQLETGELAIAVGWSAERIPELPGVIGGRLEGVPVVVQPTEIIGPERDTVSP